MLSRAHSLSYSNQTSANLRDRSAACCILQACRCAQPVSLSQLSLLRSEAALTQGSKKPCMSCFDLCTHYVGLQVEEHQVHPAQVEEQKS